MASIREWFSLLASSNFVRLDRNSFVTVTPWLMAANGRPREQAEIAGGNIARVYNFDAARLTVPA